MSYLILNTNDYNRDELLRILYLPLKETYTLDELIIEKMLDDKSANLIKKMMDLSSVLSLCADNREPHRLAGYVHELAGMFHKYYAKYKIIDEEKVDLSMARLYLISAVQNVISISLDLMGISSPKKM